MFSMSPHSSKSEPWSWDFWTGRGEGFTQADRFDVRRRCALWKLADHLWRSEAFWNAAERVANGEEPGAAARSYAPAPTATGHRAAMAFLLETTANNLRDRFDRKGRPGTASIRLAQPLGPKAYFIDASRVRLAASEGGQAAVLDRGLPKPYAPSKRVPEDGRALSRPAARALALGARAIVRRGAGQCLSCGEPLAETRIDTYSGDRKGSRRVDYCAGCEAADLDGSVYRRHLDVMRLVLDQVADYLNEPAISAWRDREVLMVLRKKTA